MPHEAVGLSFIGLEMGEWTKFLPKVQGDLYPVDRTFFYIPPISLSLMLLAWTIGWSNGRWKTWITRGIAVFVSLLVFPSIESIQYESSDQWVPRLILVSIVVLAVPLVSLAAKLESRYAMMLKWGAIALLGLVGAVIPLWTYMVIKPEIEAIFGSHLGVGPGLWLNTLAHLLLMGVGCFRLVNIVVQSQAEPTAA